MSTTYATERPGTTTQVPLGVRPSVTARRLATVEARRALMHPLVWLGFVLSTASLVNAQSYVPVLHRDTPPLANHSIPLLVGALLTAYLAASRPARHDTEELVDSLPAPRATRTLGHLLALPWAASVGAIWTALAVAILYAKGGVGVPLASELAQPILLVALGAAIGTALGVWVQRPIAAVVALPVLGGIQLFLTQGDGGAIHTLAPLLSGNGWRLPEFTIRPTGWHDLYLVGLISLIAVVALARDGMTRHRAGAGLTASAIVAVGAAGQLGAKPTLEEIDELLAFAEQPPLVCEAHGSVEVCTLPGYLGLAAYWAASVEDVLAITPDRLRTVGALRIEHWIEPWQVFETMRDWYPAQAAVDFEHERRSEDHGLFGPFVPGGLRLTDGEYAIDSHWSPSRHAIALALEASRRIVGIPDGDASTYTWTAEDLATLEAAGYLPDADVSGATTSPEPGTTVEMVEQCWLAGQAREVVAIWLAASSSPENAVRLREIVATGALFDETIDGPYGIDVLTEQYELFSSAFVAWSKVGAELAAQLLAVPDARDRIFADWRRWTDPATTTDDLAVTFDLEPPPRTVDGFGDPYEAEIHGPITPDGEAAPLPRPLRREVSACTDPET